MTSRNGHCHGTFYAAHFELEVHECGGCGVIWAVSQGFIENRKRDHKTFYCPNGCHWHYPQESDEERTKRLLKTERERSGRLSAQLDQTMASLRSTKGVVTRQKKTLSRVAKGVCPCCNRSFRDLKRHMASKHPNFDGAKV